MAFLKIPDADIRTENLIYYLNDQCEVVWANERFEGFARDNGAPELAGTVVGSNVLRQFSGVHCARWRSIYEALLGGRLRNHVERFSCPSPSERREYLLRIVPKVVGNHVCLRHETVRLSDLGDRPAYDGVSRLQGGHSADGLRFAAVQRPLEVESGDGVWVREDGDGKAILMIADAMGHGAAAAAALRHFFRMVEADPLDNLKQTIVRANRKFLARPGRMPGSLVFVTGLLMLVDPARRRMQAVCFGHHGVIFTPGGAVDIPGGLPVGILPDCDDWPVVSLDIAALGPRMLAYTDGIVEQFDPAGRMYGSENLAGDFLGTAQMPLVTSLAAILENLDRWRGEALPKDDQTLLGIDLHA